MQRKNERREKRFLGREKRPEEEIGFSIPNQEDHAFYAWVNWSSDTGCSPLVGVSMEPRALPVGLHAYISFLIEGCGEAPACPKGAYATLIDKSFDTSGLRSPVKVDIACQNVLLLISLGEDFF